MTFPFTEDEPQELDANLYPGSRWERSAKGKTTTVTVLLLANVGLNEKKADKHPPLVVFQRENGQVLALDAFKFANDRTYVADPSERIGKLVGMILGSGEEADEDTDIDSIKLDDEDASADDQSADGLDEVTDVRPKTVKASNAVEGPDVEDEGGPEDDDYIPVFEPETVLVNQTEINLDQAFQGFEQYPFGGTETAVLTRLTFSADEDLSLSSLVDALGKVGRFSLDTDTGRYYYDLVELADVKRRITGAGVPLFDAFVLVTEVPDPMEAVAEELAATMADATPVAQPQTPVQTPPGQAPVTHIIPQVQVAPAAPTFSVA